MFNTANISLTLIWMADYAYIHTQCREVWVSCEFVAWWTKSCVDTSDQGFKCFSQQV